MNLDIIVLIITGVFAVLAFAFIVAAVLISENNVSKHSGTTGNTNVNKMITSNMVKGNKMIANNIGIDKINTINSINIVDNTNNIGMNEFYCTSEGMLQLAPAPSFKRLSAKSNCLKPLSIVKPEFKSVKHTIQKLYRTRELSDKISPNHWLGNAMYGDNNYFCVYPYFGSINDDSFSFSWPNKSSSQLIGTSDKYDSGMSDISYNIASGPIIKVGSSGNKILSCDILDIDALVGTVVWQYENPNNGKTGSLIIPLAQGSPFITIEMNNINATLECNFDFALQPYQNKNIYLIEISGSTDGYAIFLPIPLTLKIQNGVVVIPRMIGTIRIAYFNSIDMLNILTQHYQTYPIEATISTTSQGTGINDINDILDISRFHSWNVDTSFIWTTKNMLTEEHKRNSGISIEIDNKLLMIALPHHNITNITYESSNMSHPLISPVRFIITHNNIWNIADAVANYQFIYPVPSQGMTGIMSLIWDDEIKIITNSPPQDTIDWVKWLGSLAILILIGNMLQKDITDYRNILEGQLSLIQNKLGMISKYKMLVYDKTWGGIIDSLGLTNCMGNSNHGNSFYESHIGQYGYIMLAYAVAGYFNPKFINSNRETALYFIRDTINPYQSDNSFPLWRNKNWYLGYSISSGLQYGQINGKDTSNIGEIIAGYYAAFLLSLILSNNPNEPNELINWSLGLLASEITALQHYFQLRDSNEDIITVDSKFIQRTITNRGDTYYKYTVSGGNPKYPERNASIMVPMLKPLTLMSFDYINNKWAMGTKQWVESGVTGDIQSESLAYALAVLTVENNPKIKQQAIETIIANHKILLPYGSTWSSILYWILNQS
jgi:hypothetical protein